MMQKTDHARLAVDKSREAHAAWLEALRADDDDDDERHIEAMQRGDAAWREAEENLRLAGVANKKLSEDERETLLADPCFAASGHATPDDFESINFKPLERAVFVSEAIKFFNRAVLAVLLFGAGAIYGWHLANDGAQVVPTIQIEGA